MKLQQQNHHERDHTGNNQDALSILAGQMNDPIRIIEPDAGLGKISELDALGVNLTPIAVAACECGCLVVKSRPIATPHKAEASH